MTIKVLMSKLWPKAGGRTRAVMVRNESIFENISNQVELFTMERTDDPEERIAEAKKRFGTNFDIKDVFNQLRYIKSNKTETYTNSEYVDSIISIISSVDFKINSVGNLVTVVENGEEKLTFYNVNGLVDFQNEGDNRAKLSYLVSEAKIITGFKENNKSFRLVNDSRGRIMSLGKYDSQGNGYLSEKYFNIYGQIIYEFMTEGTVKDESKRTFYLYIQDGKMFKGNNSEKNLTEYLWNEIISVQDGDTVIVDEPKFYLLVLKLGSLSVNRIFYFHWHNFGDNEKKLLQDSLVPKKLVFLTDYQRKDFLHKAQATDNDSIQTVVIDNFLELPNMTVKRSQDGYIQILFIGRLASEKNVERVISVFNEFYKKHENARLTIIGDGPLMSELKTMVAELNIKNVVKFVGNVLLPYNSEYVETVDIALLTPKREAYGLVFPELISRGIPVVTIDAPYGPRKWINEDNGKLLPYSSTDQEISHAINSVVMSNISPEKVANSINIDEINRNVITKISDLIK